MARESTKEKGTLLSSLKAEEVMYSEEEEEDLLEPQFYPDATLFRSSLEGLSQEEEAFKRNLMSNKATLRALAPYLQILHKDQRRKIESAKKRKPKPVLVTVIKKSKDQIIGEVPDLSEDPELISSIVETGETLRDLINARKVFVYIVNHEKNELFGIPNEHWRGTQDVVFKIEDGTSMAAYVAFWKDVALSKNVLLDSRFPRGLGILDSVAKYGLAVPIKTPDDDVVAVYEFDRDGFSVPFGKKDVQTVLAVTGWVGAGVLQKATHLNLRRQYEITQCLQQLSSHYHCNLTSPDNALSDFVLLARDTIDAEHCSYYIIVRMTKDYFILEEYEQESEKIMLKKYKNRIVQDKDSYLFKVLMGKELVNLNGDKMKETNNAVTSVLCVPILCSCKEVLGAVELANKRGGEYFSKDDEITMTSFSTFFSVQCHFIRACKNAKKAELQQFVISDLLTYHIRPCSHDLEGIKRKKLPSLPENFFTFAWYPSPDDMPRLAEITISMFQEVLGKNFMALNNVPKFILTVQKCYRPNPYHNFLHAFVVTHTMANIVSRCHPLLNGLERQGLLIAALCHDLDHRGYTNNFIQLTKHHLSSLYPSSPLENHHYRVAKKIIEKCGFFSYYQPTVYDAILNKIYKFIIATDLSLYFQCRMELMRIADDKTLSFKNPDHRHLVMSLIMTTCDLSGQTKPMAISKKITEDVYEEFYQQGDIEKKMGFTPIPTMDRDKKDMIFENQVQFLNVAVIPCIETVSKSIGTLGPIVEETKALMRQWKKLLEEKQRKSTKQLDKINL